MESTIKTTIINAHNGKGWYPQGQRRLVRSLNGMGWNWDIQAYSSFSKDTLYDPECPYTIKADAFSRTIEAAPDYTHFVWLDCSVWAVKNPNPFMDIVNEKGYYFHGSGYNCAQVCSDACLEYFQITRDEAEAFPDCSSSIFGLNVGNPLARKFLDQWLQAAKDGIFHGSRLHDNQSKDPRFQFHRQDQACASVILGKLGMKLFPHAQYARYDAPENGDYGDKVMFVMRGM
jgi:hypothetical protein